MSVLGELLDPLGALRCLQSVLKPGEILSISEIIIDPDYHPRSRVRRLAEGIGFQLDSFFGSPLTFTINFRKPA